jgi:AraC-like DNA-binding protein
MLHGAYTIGAPGGSPGGRSSISAADLVAGARRALDDDPRDVGHYLDRLAAMFGDAETHGGQVLAAGMAHPALARAPVKGGLASWQLRRVVLHMEERLSETITVDALAHVARLSSGHFCRAFKATTGETPHAFLIHQRVRRAQTLMLRTNDTLSAIAFACGLTDQAHLTRLFRRVVGETPMVWRRTWRQA